ncbi:hypothetical protein D3OALGA1CA_1577 [Olavius algarvensis associated proteobacterium Delta 3]|nr:hypothetical protein D3OALGB2SA_376 [Olavius algarvensis associated proteobacterium Delta 3]CAB5103291.1 hypothetical protein D3OALGA1CA_1577 [Olavius algarvensis associated proteobacterium Delta 3]
MIRLYASNRRLNPIPFLNQIQDGTVLELTFTYLLLGSVLVVYGAQI